jgi:uncharacterized membrane protein
MEAFDYIFVVAWFAVSVYLTWIGFLMMTNANYRNRITAQLFRIENDTQEKRLRNFVRYMKGPLYFVGGVGLMILGIYLWK